MPAPALRRRAILLHGLGRSARSMRAIERALSGDGFDVLNIAYPSRTADVLSLAADVAAQIERWAPDESIDFVSHSLGGILMRVAVANGLFSAHRVHRAVMLGPPNRGSELADVLPSFPVIGSAYRRLTGPAGIQLGTGSHGIAAQLPAVDFPLGVIAGNRSWNPLFSAILGQPNDGKVRVESTRVDGMSDFLEVPVWHPLLPTLPSVITQVRYFLQHGRFRR